jgi:tRNA threonylcarbamoyladenosine biosynthesis protein TsaE
LAKLNPPAPSATADGAGQAGATLVGLHGELGSGKTTFVQLVGKKLGVKESITSPTFVIMKSYSLTAKRYTLLVHIDAYRLDSGKDLLALGWQEIMADPKNLILLEWPERVSDILPKNYPCLDFQFMDDTTRKINFFI